MMFARAVGDPHPAYHGAITGTPAIAPPTFVWAADHYDPDSAVRPKPDEPWLGSGATPSGAPPRRRRGSRPPRRAAVRVPPAGARG
ncbi:hypothetical protein ACFSTC_20270 [Nonomuraea ferruginea]